MAPVIPISCRVIAQRFRQALCGMLVRRRRVLATGWLLPLWLLAFPVSGADEAGRLESQVKAAFLYKFANYVEWPQARFPEEGTPITIAVMGAEPIAAELERVAVGRTAQGRPIAVKRLSGSEPLEGLHIVFAGRDETTRLARVAEAAEAHSILVVTDSAGALDKGSMINFILADGKVRFEIALDTAEKSGLKVSSRLLAVAQQVRTGAP